VDSAFTAWGLLGAGTVMELLLSFPVLSLVFIVALLGLFRSILAVTETGSAGPLGAFFIMNVGAFLFFSELTSLSVGDATSAAERASATVTRTTQEDFPAGALSAGETSFGLLLFTRAINGVVFGATKLVNEDFITAPMALVRALTSGIEWRFKSETLTRAVTEFKRDCYDPAVTLYAKDLATIAHTNEQPFTPDALDYNEIWPGSPKLVPYYDQVSSTGFRETGRDRKSCTAWWQDLKNNEEMKEELTVYKKQLDPIVLMDIAGVPAAILSPSDDDALQLMFRSFVRDPVTGRGASEFRAARNLGPVDTTANVIAETVNRFKLGTLATMIMAYGPYVQGAALAVLLYVFPLILPFVLIPGWGKMVLNYFLALAWVRSWSIGWALADRITTIAAFSVTDIDASLHDNFLRMTDAAPLVSSVLYIGTPILLAILIGGGAAALGSLLGFAGLSLGSVLNTGVRAAQGVYGIMRGR
jgi:hypothetical protein